MTLDKQASNFIYTSFKMRKMLLNKTNGERIGQQSNFKKFLASRLL